jgi:mono/diheme cytochrome c family protein
VQVASLGSACLLVAAIAAGCGSTGNGSGSSNGAGHGGMGGMMGREATTPGPSTTTTPRATTRRGGTAPATGRAIFLASGCGGCHALSAAGTTGTAGPNLDRSRPSYARVLARVTDGGGGMPSFAGSLTSAQIRALARYVSDAARQ